MVSSVRPSHLADRGALGALKPSTAARGFSSASRSIRFKVRSSSDSSSVVTTAEVLFLPLSLNSTRVVLTDFPGSGAATLDITGELGPARMAEEQRDATGDPVG
jgi:hypothetical protein